MEPRTHSRRTWERLIKFTAKPGEAINLQWICITKGGELVVSNGHALIVVAAPLPALGVGYRTIQHISSPEVLIDPVELRSIIRQVALADPVRLEIDARVVVFNDKKIGALPVGDGKFVNWQRLAKKFARDAVQDYGRFAIHAQYLERFCSLFAEDYGGSKNWPVIRHLGTVPAVLRAIHSDTTADRPDLFALKFGPSFWGTSRPGGRGVHDADEYGAIMVVMPCQIDNAYALSTEGKSWPGPRADMLVAVEDMHRARAAAALRSKKPR